MKQSFVKMMSRISEIENYILKGLVLDEHGIWVPIVEKKAVEDDFLAHLAAGQVLYEGRWVNFTEAKKVRLQPGTFRRGGPKEQAAPVAPAALPETAVITETLPPEEETRTGPAPVASAPSVEEAVDALFPPETSIIVDAASSPEEETRTGQAPPASAPVSVEAAEAVFPPETSIIVDADAPSPEEETRMGQAPVPSSDVLISTDEFAPETKMIMIVPPGGGQSIEAVTHVSRETDSYPVTDGSDREQKAVAPAPAGAADDEDTRIFNRPSVPTWDYGGEKRKKRILFIGGFIVIAAGIAGIVIIILQAPK